MLSSHPARSTFLALTLASSIAYSQSSLPSSAAPSTSSTGMQAAPVTPTTPPGANIPAAGQTLAPASNASSTAATLPALRRLIQSGHPDQALLQLDALAAQSPVPSGVQTLRGLAFYNQSRMPQARRGLCPLLCRPIPRTRKPPRCEALPSSAWDAPQDRHSPASQQYPRPQPRPLQTMPGQTPPARTMPARIRPTLTISSPSATLIPAATMTRVTPSLPQFGFPPDSAAAYLLAARMLLRREYLPVAQGFATKALERDPQLPLVHALLWRDRAGRQPP